MRRTLIATLSILVTVAMLFVGCLGYDQEDLDKEYENGYKDGYDEGYDKGFAAGQEGGYQDGYDDGLSASEESSGTRSAPVAQNYYVTRTGKCFHRPGCQYEPYKWYSSREEALADGYEPCSKCNP